ncbi:hypothetical protein TNCT_263621 [Trichonephila clavata]|uniref:Uncharacterized protein n=1 Tax=Trichonephila clavata TaxID=2740835 RepID=A0A8X6G8B7_TRICU|nr:hypothetical protein TNCT_263621 [Trichonephila clavata]
MNIHDSQNPPEADEMMQLGTDPPPTATTPATTSDAFERCAQIKKLEKLIKMKQLKIRYFTDMIEVETFDKDVADAAELESLIKEKTKAELEFAIQMVEFKVLFPCPAPFCQHANANGINSFPAQHKKDQKSPQFCRQNLSLTTTQKIKNQNRKKGLHLM